MKKFLILLLASVLLFVVSGISHIVSAEVSSKQLSAEEWVNEYQDQLREGFNKLDIDKETQEKLLNKLRRGELLDSMKPENIEKVSLSNDSTNLNDNKTFTFEDGSKVIVGNELINSASENIINLSNGTYTIRSYYYWGIVNLQFYTDFRITSGYDFIIQSYDGTYGGIGSLDKEKISIIRKYESKDYRAQSKYRIVWKAGDWATNTFQLYFQVGNNSYETTLTNKAKK